MKQGLWGKTKTKILNRKIKENNAQDSNKQVESRFLGHLMMKGSRLLTLEFDFTV